MYCGLNFANVTSLLGLLDEANLFSNKGAVCIQAVCVVERKFVKKDIFSRQPQKATEVM